MSITYREANLHDEVQLKRLNEKASDSRVLAEYCRRKKDLFTVEEYKKTGGCFWVAEDKNKIIGMVGVRFIGEDRAKVKALRVSPDYRRQGIARCLMEMLESFCRKNSIREIVLGVHATSAGAIILYESLRYVRYEEKMLDSGARALYYRKML